MMNKHQALRVAAKLNEKTLANRLVDQGANPLDTDAVGRTAIDLAASAGNHYLAKELRRSASAELTPTKRAK